jgi:hypothetical protein
VAAEEYYTTDPPSFVWLATIKSGPLLSIAVRDQYFQGQGQIDGRLL